MIDIKNNAIECNGFVKSISRWEVWFVCPYGITPSLKEACEKCLACDLDPDLNINPVSVAIASDGYYEMWFPRR